MTLSQLLACAYQFSQHVELRVHDQDGQPAVPYTLGLREEYVCERCTPALKQERGGCPYEEQRSPAEVPHFVDSTGDDEHDAIQVCPRGVLVRELFASQTVQTYQRAKAAGSYREYTDAALGVVPSRCSWVWAELGAIETRFVERVRQTRREMNRRPK